jgi:hypothetical protein
MKKKQKGQRKNQENGSRSSSRGRKTSTSSSNWDQTVREATGGEVSEQSVDSSSEMERGEFTPGEVGQIAPLDQEGEGNRQNAEAQELEEIEPDRFLKPR